MKKQIYFIRHGETNWNKESRFQGSTDIPLNETGIQQAKDLSSNISHLKIDMIVASPLKRALLTAEIVNEKLNVPLITNQDLIERKYGKLEGCLQSELIEKYKDCLVIKNNNIDWAKSTFPTAETPQKHSARLFKALHDTFKNHDVDNVLFASHGCNMHAFINIVVIKNCSCFSAIYDTDTEIISDTLCLYPK